MKKIILISSFLFVMLSACRAPYLREEAKNTKLLNGYSALFEKDKIAENFRTLNEKYPAVKINKSNTPYIIPDSLSENVLPASFTFEGKDYDIAGEIKKRAFTSLLVIKNGKVIFEQYYQGNEKYDPVILFSCTKSIIGLLTGIAYEKGYIKSLNDPAVKYAPELKGTVYEQITVQNLLNMSSGVKWSEDYGDLNSEMVQSFLAALKGSLNDYTKRMKTLRPQGVFNQYTSMDAQVLAMIVAGATKKKLEVFFKDNLWSKIHAENNAYFLMDKTGFPIAYGGLMMSARDLSKIGLLLLNEGKNCKGEPVFSKEWINQSITPAESHLMPGKRRNSDSAEGYKNLWWLPVERDKKDFSAIGIYGQTLYVNPGKNIIIVSNGAYADYNDDIIGDTRRLKMFQTIAKYIDR